MKLYEITIKPVSAFGTPLKGDTIFGHFCWQAAYDAGLLEGGLERWIARYPEQPFAVFSSAWPKFTTGSKSSYALKRPDIPLSFIFPAASGSREGIVLNYKNNKKKKWMIVDESFKLDVREQQYWNDKELLNEAWREATDETKKSMQGETGQEFMRQTMVPHNTISRLTQTTGEGGFAPYTEKALWYYPETELAVFVLVDEEATDIGRIRKALSRIGRFGFGKNASIGHGRFEVVSDDDIPIKIPRPEAANACYALGPVVPQEGSFRDCWFSPFVRFGKHGDFLACSEKPFKNPVIMADEGAVFPAVDETVFEKPYLGRALLSVSKGVEKTVTQGYAPYLPFRLEMT